MKKIIFAVICGLFLTNIYAEESLCGYKDYFHLVDDVHPSFSIVAGHTDGDVLFYIVSQRSFVVRDTWQCRSGYAHVRVATDNLNWCLLDIKDGPYMSHPVINATCNGDLNYRGTRYDGTNSYAYTLKFD